MSVPRKLFAVLLGAALPGAATIVVATLPSGAAGSSGGRAEPVVVDRAGGTTSKIGELGVVPNVVGGRVTAQETGNLIYNGGPVQHSSKIYAIFWEPSGRNEYYLPPEYRNTITQYMTDVANASYTTGNVFSVTTQYYDESGPGKSENFVAYNISYGGSIIDRDPFPTSGCANYIISGSTAASAECLTDAQIQAEVNKEVDLLKLPRGLASEYFLYTPFQVASCFNSAAKSCFDPSGKAGYCAYHSGLVGSNTVTLYANMPYDDVQGCKAAEKGGGTPEFPNNSDADPTISTTSHELSETMTDPTGSGWKDSSNMEIGDLCAYTFGTPRGADEYQFSQFNQIISGDFYWTQQEWSNRSTGGGCLQHNPDVQPKPTLAVSPASPAHGQLVTFTATVTDSDDTSFTYAWSFGDGATSTLSKATHTYSSAGPRTVTLVVTDHHGDAVRLTHSVTVS